MGKSVVMLMFFVAFLAVPSLSSAESTTINFDFEGLIPPGSCEPEPCKDCEECQQCEQCPVTPTKNLVALGKSLGLTTFLLAAKACGLNEQFTNPNHTYTIFAPTNLAFDSLPDGFLRFLLDSPETFTPLLLGHVVEAALSTTAMVDGMKVPPLVRQLEISFDLTEGVKVLMMDFTSAKVISADNFATNGVIHVVDGLLLFNLLTL